jgi:hypothetical protein
LSNNASSDRSVPRREAAEARNINQMSTIK